MKGGCVPHQGQAVGHRYVGMGGGGSYPHSMEGRARPAQGAPAPRRHPLTRMGATLRNSGEREGVGVGERGGGRGGGGGEWEGGGKGRGRNGWMGKPGSHGKDRLRPSSLADKLGRGGRPPPAGAERAAAPTVRGRVDV